MPVPGDHLGKSTLASTTSDNPPPPITPTLPMKNSRLGWMSYILRCTTCIVILYDLIGVGGTYFEESLLLPSFYAISSIAACCPVIMVGHVLYLNYKGIARGVEWHLDMWALHTTSIISAGLIFCILQKTDIWLTPLFVFIDIPLFIGISNLCNGSTCQQNQICLLLGLHSETQTLIRYRLSRLLLLPVDNFVNIFPATEDPGASNTTYAPTETPLGWTSIILHCISMAAILYDAVVVIIGWPEAYLPSYCALFGVAVFAGLIMVFSAWHNRLQGYEVTRGAEWHLHACTTNVVCVLSALVIYLVENPIYPPWAVFLFPAFAIVDILLFITISNVCIQRGLVRESPIYLGLIDHFSSTRKPLIVRFSFFRRIRSPKQIHSLLQSLVVVVVDAEAALPATQSRFDCDNASEVKKEPMDIV